jgi:hypothetical protein
MAKSSKKKLKADAEGCESLLQLGKILWRIYG